jgi:hypothetical protein
MAENKTKATNASVNKFLNGIKDETSRKDCFTILELMKKITKAEPKMWGSSIVGFGNFHYKSKSGREGDWFLFGFSPRKTNLTIYASLCDLSLDKELLKKIGKHKTGKSCLYIKSLADVDMKVLKEFVIKSMNKSKKVMSQK